MWREVTIFTLAWMGFLWAIQRFCHYCKKANEIREAQEFWRELEIQERLDQLRAELDGCP